MAKFISDAEMAELEKKEPKAKTFISDEEMAQLEKPQMSRGQALKKQGANALTFGLAPFAAGVGGGAGAATEGFRQAKGGLLDKLGAAYEKGKEGFSEARGEYNQELARADEQYPGQGLLSSVGGGIATLPLTPVKTLGGALKLGAGLGAAEGLSTAEDAGDFAKKVGEGAVMGGVGDVASRGLVKAGGKLKKFAEKAASNATGATGLQASKFKPNAGRELLDRKIVRFGDSQEKIAQRATKAVKGATDQIDSSLKKLDADGVTVDANEIYNSIGEQINKMRADPSKADVAKLMENELENLIKATDAKGGTRFGIQEAEEIKRGYNRKAGNWMDPEKGMTGKALYRSYRDAVEKAAKAKDPKTAALFEEGKKSYGLLAPIQEAAERRASTTAQSPPLGLLDATTAAGGLLGGGALGGVVAPVARRLIGPRLSSTGAVSADKISDLLAKTSDPKARALLIKALEGMAPE